MCQEGYDLSKRPMVDLLLVVADEAQSGEGVIGFGTDMKYIEISHVSKYGAVENINI